MIVVMSHVYVVDLLMTT